jgi:hypothetical protein
MSSIIFLEYKELLDVLALAGKTFPCDPTIQAFLLVSGCKKIQPTILGTHQMVQCWELILFRVMLRSSERNIHIFLLGNRWHLNIEQLDT